ncbi:MAG: sensor histidine kinase [Mycobacteriales bacterium]
MSLRLRLLVGLVAMALVGIGVTDTVTYLLLQSSLFRRVDLTLQAAEPAALRSLLGADHGFGGPPGPGPVGPEPGRRAFGLLPPGTYAALLTPSGTVLSEESFGFSPGVDAPRLPAPLPALAAGGSALRTVPATTGTAGYRLLLQALPGGGVVAVGVPLADTQSTLHTLLVSELLVSFAALVGLSGLAWWTVRAGLRPLERIGRTAGAIAAGDLGRRVSPATPRTEVGRLGLALNAMLAQIEQAFLARTASEERLRRFVADASHELRTPLALVRGYAELFRRGARTRPEDLETAMRRIEEESGRMGRLVEELLLLARLDEGRTWERSAVDLAELVRQAGQDARVVDPTRPVTVVAAAPVVVAGDEERLRQVIANLVRNALVHTPPGTPVDLAAQVAGNTGVVTVADRGPGLPAGTADRVFERFYRADPSRSRDSGGTGLGLAIVSAVVAAHGGQVAVSETPGGGATFEVKLALATA